MDSSPTVPICEIEKQVLDEVSCATSVVHLDELKVKFLGKKGLVTQLLKRIAEVDPVDRKTFGAQVNSLRCRVEEVLGSRARELKKCDLESRLSCEKIDITLPVKSFLSCYESGSLHPLTTVQRDLEGIFRGLGFTVVDGPIVEREYYNFDALNVPDSHPARDMQDTFWTRAGDVLRTQTSSIQARTLETMAPPLRVVSAGRVFRCERSDAKHDHTFYQMEGMMVDRVVTIGHLTYFIRSLLREVLGFEPKIRLRPGFFPFVEPGFELDIWFNNRWMELLPCGLVHPKLFEYAGLDSAKWQGFAFGLGLSRLVMSRYEIDDIRLLQGGDLRFLKQFS